MYKFENYSRKEILEAVKQDGYALRYVKEQDREICLEAVKQDGLALQYVKEQDREICLEAVKQDGLALRYVENYYEEMKDLDSPYMEDYIKVFEKDSNTEIREALVNLKHNIDGILEKF